MKRYILIAGLIIALIASSNAQVPDWAKTYNHKKYPTSRYFLGVGIAKDKNEAIELARADVAKQIQIKIEQELESIESEFREGERAFIKSETSARTKSMVTETVTGIQVVETKQVKENFYVLAVLNRAQYLSGLEVQMDEILQKTEQLVSNARELTTQGKVFAAVNNYLDAQNTIPEFYTKSALYTALSAQKYPNLSQFTGPGIIAELRTVLANINLKLIEGANQRGQVGKPLPRAVLLQVVYQKNGQEIGVSNFPVVAQYLNGNIIQRLESNPDGKVAFQIVAVPTDAGGDRGSVCFKLDLNRLPEEMRNALSKSEIVVEYDLENVGLAFAVKVSPHDTQLVPSLASDLQQLIVTNGYSIAYDAPYYLESALTVVNQKEIPTPAGKQYLVEIRLRLNLRYTGNNTLLNSLEVSGKGLDTQSPQVAIEKAYRNARIGKEKLAAFLQSAAGK